jgi:hypothetical protein
MNRYMLCAAAAWILCMANGAGAQDAATVGVVANVKVLSDKVEDVSSLEAWKKSWIKEGMSDQDKAIAIWKTMVKYRFQCTPPEEGLTANVHDAMKMINVYGHCQCCCASACVAELARYIGLKAQVWDVNIHTIAEVFYDDSWHMLDCAYGDFWYDDKGKIAGVAELNKGITEWLAAHPDYHANPAKYAADWKNGPKILSKPGYYVEANMDPSGPWQGIMHALDMPKPSVSGEVGFSQGYQVNIRLRQGERLTRNWFNKGLETYPGTADPAIMQNGRSSMTVQTALGDIAPGRIGNGVYEYDACADGNLSLSALTFDNVGKNGQSLRVTDESKSGVLVFEMPSSYPFLTAVAQLKAVVGEGGQIVVSVSTNNGLDFKTVGTITAGGEQKIDFDKNVHRLYNYRLKLEFKGKGTGVDALKVTHDIQHSQAPLPALAKGKNTITFCAGPQEGTLTIEPDISGNFHSLTVADFHGVRDGTMKEPNLKVPTGQGSVTFPIEAPGDITRIRMGGFYRARAPKDGYDMQVSFDDGKTFSLVGKMVGPWAGMTEYDTFDKVPAGTKAVKVRFAGKTQNTTMMRNFRIDADYKLPNSGFAPVQITYTWEEGGVAKKDVHVAKAANETYQIDVGDKAVMKSIVLELAK